MQSSGTPGKVPKFTSFRPKSNLPQNDSVREDPSQSPQEYRHHDHYGHERRHKSRREEIKSRSLELDTPERVQRSENLQSGVSNDQIFVSDKRGDVDNVRYGSIHRYAIPKYGRAGLGSVVGLHWTTKIDRSSSTEKGLVLINKNLQVKRDKHIFAKVRSQEEVQVRPRHTGSLDELRRDYLLLDNSRDSHRGRNVEGRRSPDGTSSSSDDDEHYRSIDGRARPPSKLDDHAPTSDTEDYKRGDSLSGNASSIPNATRSVLLTKVEKEPGSPNAWFELIQHQDALHSQSRVSRRSTWSEEQSYADIKVSLYEKALKAVTDPSAIESLLHGLFKEAQLVWDDNRLRKKWEDALSKQSHSRRLWIQYLGFMQTNSKNFKFDDIKDAYDRCFQMILQPGSIGSNALDAETYSYLLLRLTLFLRGAGFSEQAFAIWQANLEWNLRTPLVTAVEFGGSRSIEGIAKVKRSFEDFWDAEVPRIGEQGSLGWAAYPLQHGEVQVPETHALDAAGEPAPMLERWGVFERNDGAQSFLPSRTTENASEDDPYRVVLYADIEPYLLDISGTNLGLLVNSFFWFCGLPPLRNEENESSKWGDIFVRDSTVDSVSLGVGPDQGKLSDNLSSSEDHEAAKRSPFDMTLQSFSVSLDTLFAQPLSWFSAFQSWASKKKEASYRILLGWLRRSLETIINAAAAEVELLQYFIAFELYFNLESARKLSKSLIRKHPSNLKLYNVHALVEYRLGESEKARDILKKAIQMSSENLDIALLRRTLIWETMNLEGAEAALSQFLDTSGEDQMKQGLNSNDASTILAVQKELLSSRDRAISSKSYPQALANIDLLILLSYITNPHSLQAALAIFTTNTALLSTFLPATSPTQQLLHQSLARLLYYHATHSASFQPSLLRSTLSQSISLFPTNTIFLSLYAWNEARFRIDDRVRSVVREILDPPPSTGTTTTTGSPQSQLIPHLFALHTELNRPQALGSNAHTIRSTFERALSTSRSSEGVAHSPLIWFEYFHFEVRVGDLKRAKDVFYRAIGKVPWVKELYLLPWRYLGDVMGREELKGIYELVGERELRIRVQAQDV